MAQGKRCDKPKSEHQSRRDDIFVEIFCGIDFKLQRSDTFNNWRQIAYPYSGFCDKDIAPLELFLANKTKDHKGFPQISQMSAEVNL